MVGLLVGDPVEETSFTAASVGHTGSVLEEGAGTVVAGGGNADSSLAQSAATFNVIPQCLRADVRVGILRLRFGVNPVEGQAADQTEAEKTVDDGGRHPRRRLAKALSVERYRDTQNWTDEMLCLIFRSLCSQL